jgi:Rrf2 family protein
MLSRTAELGVQIMLYVVLKGEGAPVPPRQMAELLEASPTYTAKVANMLVKAGVLRAQRGARGGVFLDREPGAITLLEIVEACQGKVLADYCAPYDDLAKVCAFHRAMADLHRGVTDVLQRWTLADIAAKPCPDKSIAGTVDCRLKWCRKLARPARSK